MTEIFGIPTNQAQMPKPTTAEEYEMARRLGDARFLRDCPHDKVRDGHCLKCLRKVVAR